MTKVTAVLLFTDANELYLKINGRNIEKVYESKLYMIPSTIWEAYSNAEQGCKSTFTNI